MSVASLEYCEELYKLSRWDGTDEQYRLPRIEYCPAYPIGYILRKLPPVLENVNKLTLTAEHGRWRAKYGGRRPLFLCQAGNPEDALCKLAIELFKQGVLK